MVMLMLRLRHMVRVARPARPLAWIAADARATLADPDRMMGGLVAMACIALFQQSFAFLKAQIPVLVPFAWDETFAAWDRALHFGRYPHEWLGAVMDSPALLSAINMAYHAWFMLMFLLFFAAAFTRRDPVGRMTFLIAMVLTWAVGGNLLATLLSSAGPVYYARLGFGDVYDPLMAALAQAGTQAWLPALDVQAMLWDGYLGRGTMKGISAMPSMHVAGTVVMTCYAFTLRRWMGWAMVAFLGVILVGSVALAWHYAIDGYAGIALALALWPLSRWLAARTVGTEAVR